MKQQRGEVANAADLACENASLGQRPFTWFRSKEAGRTGSVWATVMKDDNDTLLAF